MPRHALLALPPSRPSPVAQPSILRPSPRDNKASHDAEEKEEEEDGDHAKCASWRRSIHLSCFIIVMHGRRKERERERERERDVASHCDQKNFWGVSQSSMTIVVTRYFIAAGEGNFDPHARLSQSKQANGMSCCRCRRRLGLLREISSSFASSNIIYCQKRTAG